MSNKLIIIYKVKEEVHKRLLWRWISKRPNRVKTLLETEITNKFNIIPF